MSLHLSFLYMNFRKGTYTSLNRMSSNLEDYIVQKFIWVQSWNTVHSFFLHLFLTSCNPCWERILPKDGTMGMPSSYSVLCILAVFQSQEECSAHGHGFSKATKVIPYFLYLVWQSVEVHAQMENWESTTGKVTESVWNKYTYIYCARNLC